MITFFDKKKKLKNVNTIAKKTIIQAFWPDSHYCTTDNCNKCKNSCIGYLEYEITKDQNTVRISTFGNKQGKKAPGVGIILFYTLLKVLPKSVDTVKLIAGGDPDAKKFYKKIGLDMEENIRQEYIKINENPEKYYAGSPLTQKIEIVRKNVNLELSKFWKTDESICNIM